MIVYHGTNRNFDKIDLTKSKDNRDFGKGFYTTSLPEQASHWLVANDNTMRTIALYISGIYTTSQAIEQLRFFKTNNQISFHTEKALVYLKYLETKEV